VWVDYVIYLTTGLVLLAGIGLFVIVIRNRGGSGVSITLVVLLVIGLVATPLVRPERFRDTGEDLVVVQGDGTAQTRVDQIGGCLSVFRQLGPLSFIVGNDLFPGDDWDRGPSSDCEASGHSGMLNLPNSVGSGGWMLCDHSTCYPLTASMSA
jgi:hypothetical protein